MQCKEIAVTLAHQQYMQSFSVELRGTHIYRFASDGYNDERHVKLCAATNRHALPTLQSTFSGAAIRSGKTNFPPVFKTNRHDRAQQHFTPSYPAPIFTIFSTPRLFKHDVNTVFLSRLNGPITTKYFGDSITVLASARRHVLCACHYPCTGNIYWQLCLLWWKPTPGVPPIFGLIQFVWNLNTGQGHT
jgi:hypothetical protein